jgi:hypothetical protein
VPASTPFPIRTPEDDEGFDQNLGGFEKRFKAGRNWDHLMCPFQCDLFHFRNIQEREPLFGHRKNILLLQCIHRALIDAFWAREPSTVRANLRGAKRLEEFGDTLGMRAVCPTMGPYLEEDTFGIPLGVCILIRSLDPGNPRSSSSF